MSTTTTIIREGRAQASLRARQAGFFWLTTLLTGTFALVVYGRLVVPGNAAASTARVLAHEPLFGLAVATNLIAGACYMTATMLVYGLFKPVSRSLSLLAALCSLVGCAIGALSELLLLAPLAFWRGAWDLGAFAVEHREAFALLFLGLQPQASDISFRLFGLYCLLVGGLILRATFRPRMVGD